MTGTPNTSRFRPWLDKIQEEFDRAMERERQLRAAMREDRLRLLNDKATKVALASRVHDRRAIS